MRILFSALIPGSLALLGPLATPLGLEGMSLATHYDSLEVLRVEREVSYSMEVTTMEMEVNGESRDMGDRQIPKTTTGTRQVYVDDYTKTTEGKPTHIKRTFEEWSGSRESDEGTQEIPKSPKSPEAGLVLEIKVKEDGEQEIKVLEGEAPEDEAFMESQPLTLAIDGLFPEEAVELEGKWDLESDAIKTLIGKISPERGPRPEGQRRRRGGDDHVNQDRRQGRLNRMGGNIGAYLKDAEWSGEATLTSIDKEYEGEVCGMIKFTVESEGDMPEREARQRRGQGEERRLGTLAPLTRVEGDVSIKLKGTLYYSIEGKHPIAMVLEGELSTSETTVRGREDMEMTMYVETEGELKLSYNLSHSER